MKTIISSNFPFQSKYINVLDSNIHYIDLNKESEKTFLFIHGNPTSIYLWRNIIPYVSPLGRTVALDLVGMGKSGKPKIEYSFQDHIAYLDVFIKKLVLKNVILVIHDWGGALGLNYAKNHSENVKGVVFMETFAKPMEWNDLDFMARWLFKKFRHPTIGQNWNGKHNVFLRFILQASIIRRLSKQEKQTYFEPFKTIESRKPIVKFPQELPFNEEGTINEKIAKEYFEWLKKSTIPKLLLYAKPGVQIQKKQLEFYKNNLQKLTTTYIGRGKHYIQEDQPQNIGEAIEQWFLLNY